MSGAAQAASIRFDRLSPSARFAVHQWCAENGLFSSSDGPSYARVLTVTRLRPAEWRPHVPRPAPRYYGRGGGGRSELDYIGDCDECGVELWGSEGEEDEEEDSSEKQCLRCGGDYRSKYDVMGRR